MLLQGALGMRVSREHEARAARAERKRDFWQNRGETATPDYIPLGLEDPVRPFVLENDGERQQRTAHNEESFLGSYPATAARSPATLRQGEGVR